MKCAVCKSGETKSGVSTVVLTRDHTTVVIRSVPALVCGNCGEEYVDSSVAASLLRNSGAAARGGAEVEIRDYAVPA